MTFALVKLRKITERKFYSFTFNLVVCSMHPFNDLFKTMFWSVSFLNMYCRICMQMSCNLQLFLYIYMVHLHCLFMLPNTISCYDAFFFFWPYYRNILWYIVVWPSKDIHQIVSFSWVDSSTLCHNCRNFLMSS